jgi:hypothetical protein
VKNCGVAKIVGFQMSEQKATLQVSECNAFTHMYSIRLVFFVLQDAEKLLYSLISKDKEALQASVVSRNHMVDEMKHYLNRCKIDVRLHCLVAFSLALNVGSFQISSLPIIHVAGTKVHFYGSFFLAPFPSSPRVLPRAKARHQHSQSQFSEHMA